jgi:hypothetical protein
MGNRTPNLNIPIPYPRSANIDELFDWERFLHDAFIVVDTAVGGINNIITQLNNSFGSINTAITNLNNAITEIRNSDILLNSRIRIAGFRPLSTLLSELDNEGGGLLYFPAGTYPINSTLIVPANVRLMGNNAVLRPTESFYNSGDNPMFSVAGRGVVFDGLVFEGHPTNNDVRVSAIATNGNETTVVRCQFLRMGYSAIDHRSTTKDGVLRIRDSKFEDCWGDCILTNLSLDANSVVFTHPTFAISTVASYRGYGVGIKAFTQAGQTLRMVLQNVEFNRLLRTAILLTANPAHPPYEVRINKVKMQEVGLTRFGNPSGEASAIGNDESLYGALIYVKSTASNAEDDVGTVHITDFDVVEPYGFVVRFPANNDNRHYLSNGRYKHEASGWSGSNPFNPISLRLARAFITDVEGYAFKWHFTKQSSAYGSYDTVFQNCRFTGVGDFGGTASDNIWYINCTFPTTSPYPNGRWFIGCSGAQFYGDKVIASDGAHIDASTIHLGTFQSGMCFKTTANYGLKPQITTSGRLRDTYIYLPILLLSSDFYLFDDDNNAFRQELRYLFLGNEIVASFNDEDRLPDGRYRRLLATLPVPYNFYNGSTSDSSFNLRLRITFSYTGGRSHIIPIRVQMSWRQHGEINQVGYILHDFAPLTTTSIQPRSLYNREFIVPSDALSSFPNGGCMFIEIARQYVANETDKVYIHGVELLYPARLE